MIWECPPAETCVQPSPILSFKHQISLVDHRTFRLYGPKTLDRGVIEVQLADDVGVAHGNWIKVSPFTNTYDSQGSQQFVNCRFDAVDDGNTEEDFFDPEDPLRSVGPSSTCAPEWAFAYQGDTFSEFDPGKTGDASDGPGLEGASGIGTWIEPKFDLRRFVGRRIRIRFLASSFKISDLRNWEQFYVLNPISLDDGWFIDDVSIKDTLTEPATVTVDANDNLDIKADWDFDDVGAVCDCDPENSDVCDASQRGRWSAAFPLGRDDRNHGVNLDTAG